MSLVVEKCPGVSVLFQDEQILVVSKPGGLLSQGDRTGDRSLWDVCRDQICAANPDKENPFLGLVHRLDRPVSGVIMFGLSHEAAVFLNGEFRHRRTQKIYCAVVFGVPNPRQGRLSGFIEKTQNRRSKLYDVATEGAEPASLDYQVLHEIGGFSLLRIQPHTGRKHQIRLQMRDAGHSIVGDSRYGSFVYSEDGTIALHARSLEVAHPVTGQIMRFVAPFPENFPCLDQWKGLSV